MNATLSNKSTQYIGARYVPKFYENSTDPSSMEWENGKAYAPLTVVTYNDDTYTSKIPVPSGVGNPSENPRYWAKTGNYNAAIEALEDEIEELENYIKEANRYVNVKDFGAVGNGVANDAGAIKDAITACNQTGQILYFPRGSYFYETDETVLVNCDIDFNDSTLIVSENTPAITLFKIGEKTEPITLDQTSISEYSVSDSRLRNKSMYVKAPLSIGQRYGTGDTYDYHQFLITDKNGFIVNGSFKPSVANGTYVYYNVREYSEQRTFFKNLKVVCSDETASLATGVVVVVKNNVDIENITVDYTAVENATYAGGLITCQEVCDININNVYAVNPYGTNAAGYVIELANCGDCKISNIICVDKTGQSWGSIGTSYSTGLIYDNCITQRIDSHQCGNYTVKNCKLSYANFSGGYGIISYENCVFDFKSPFVTEKGTIIAFRNDFMWLFSGKIVVKNCTFKASMANCYVFGINMDRDTVVNTSTMKYDGLDVIFEDCDMSGTQMTPTYLFFAVPDYASKVNVELHNCKLRAYYMAVSEDDTNPCHSVKIINCDNYKRGWHTYVASHKNIAQYYTFDKFEGYYTITHDVTGDECVLSVMNTVIGSVKSKTTNAVRLIDNVITDDEAPTFLANPTYKLMKGNLIIAATNTHQSDWNN